MSTAHRKSATALRMTAKQFIRSFGLEHCVFVTLTFPGKAPTVKEASARFNSIATNLLNKAGVVRAWIRVLERGDRRGRVHYHMLCAVADDVRTGTNFEEFREKNFRSANVALRAFWSWWRRNATKYGFGRVTSLPIRSEDEAMAQYLAKYISAHIHQRNAEDKGARLVAYSKNVASSSTRFAYRSVGSHLGRLKLASLAEALGYTQDNYAEAFRRDYGAKWMYWLGPYIKGISLAVYPTIFHLIKDEPQWRDEEGLENAVEITGDDLVRRHRASVARALCACRVLFDKLKLGRAGECNASRVERGLFVPAKKWTAPMLIEPEAEPWPD